MGTRATLTKGELKSLKHRKTGRGEGEGERREKEEVGEDPKEEIKEQGQTY